MNSILLQRVSSRSSGRTLHFRSALSSARNAAAIALLTTLGLSQADAAAYTAANEAELFAAIASANASSDLDLIDLVPGRSYQVSQRLQLNSPIIVNGNGATIDGGQILFGFIINVSGEVSLNQLSVTGLTGSSSAIPLFVAGGGNLTLNNSIVSGNSARANLAGGIFIDFGATATLNNSIVSRNTAHHSAGIHNGGTLTLNSSTVCDNTGSGSGGGIGNLGGTLILNDSAVHNNTANKGGGVFMGSGVMTLIRSSIHHNLATTTVGEGGGGIWTIASTVILNDGSSIHHNAAVTTGGGIVCTADSAPGSTLELNGGSNITKNTAAFGGGIYDANSALTVVLNDGKIFKNTPDDYAP